MLPSLIIFEYLLPMQIILSFTSSLLRAKIVCEILTEDEIYNLIYKELNKNSTINISNLQGGGKNLYVGKKQKAKRNKHI